MYNILAKEIHVSRNFWIEKYFIFVLALGIPPNRKKGPAKKIFVNFGIYIQNSTEKFGTKVGKKEVLW